MTGKLLTQARLDMLKIVTSGGFQDDIVLSTPNGTIEVTVKGLTSGIWLQYDSEGNPVDTSKSHISVPEQVLIDLGYPVRSLNSGKVSMKDHRVKINDSFGTEMTFVINSVYPNETTGLIVCILGRLKS